MNMPQKRTNHVSHPQNTAGVLNIFCNGDMRLVSLIGKYKFEHPKSIIRHISFY